MCYELCVTVCVTSDRRTSLFTRLYTTQSAPLPAAVFALILYSPCLPSPLPRSDSRPMDKVDCHWDFVLKEVGWLAADFQKERARHLARAKKLVRSVETYHRGKDARREKKAKEEAQQVRRIASRMSKEVRRFWMKIDRIIAFKQKGEFEEIRQRAMDRHLIYIVKQTERYTSMIAENMRLGGSMISDSVIMEKKGSKRDLEHAENSDKNSKRVRFQDFQLSDASGTTYEDMDSNLCEDDRSLTAEPALNESSGSEEYVGEDEPDDETTLIEEEGREPEVSYEEEMALLERDQNLTVEELRAMYGNIPEDEDDGRDSNKSDESSGSEEYVGEDEPDDETTLIEEEGREPEVSYEEEMALLERDQNLTMEELRAMYGNIPEDVDDVATEKVGEDDEGVSESYGDAVSRLEAADEMARSIRVDRPFLLSPALHLREYQHIGLNWLVSLHERRLNGILADEMGLGKTIQTIALLAYLACCKGIWGPHLVIVPTSCLINWETEFKKFCPGFKILPYYGSVKTRKFLRTGWSRLNSFHVCVTSYQLVVQDAKAFRKKRWYYMILDEAHNIKVRKDKIHDCETYNSAYAVL